MNILARASLPTSSLHHISRKAAAHSKQVQPLSNMTTERTEVKYLTQDEAINLDKELFDEYAFSVDQLMELAGLSVATAIARTYPTAYHGKPIVCCGPGNNGGDGLVCARHLKLFGYSPVVICPKPGRGKLYQNLLVQCKKFHVPILDQVPRLPWSELGNLIVDSVFGFSFKPPNRNPDFAKLLNLMHENSDRSKMPLVSVDIPSGWHVENGDTCLDADQAEIAGDLKIPALQPDCLISLTAPKLSALKFRGRFHYLGGRFCPPAIRDKYKLQLPEFPAQDAIVRLS